MHLLLINYVIQMDIDFSILININEVYFDVQRWR